MNEAATVIVKSLAVEFFEYISCIDDEWVIAYFRFHSSDGGYGSSGSYQDKAGRVRLFNPFEQESFFDSMNYKGRELRKLIEENGSSFCVMLLIVDSEFNFDIKFEYHDAEKWKISKMDGLTGIPVIS